MKSFRNDLFLLKGLRDRLPLKHLRVMPGTLLAMSLCGLALAGWEAHASLPRWMQDVVSSSAIETALYRVMEIPGVKALYPRPPKEATVELRALISKAPKQADLYSLRAMEEEQALDFSTAESDWKKYAIEATDKADGQLALADYYHRRLQSSDELKALMLVGATPQTRSEDYVVAAEQRSWKAFERVQVLAADQGLDDATIAAAYAAWIARYPDQPYLYNRELHWLLYESKDGKRFDKAEALIRRYQDAFPKDAVFPLKAAALLQLKRGSVENALALYDSGFEPLWPAELVQSYYALLAESHNQHRFVAEARARLARNPDDLNAMARLFYYAQQQGNLQEAKGIVESYRIAKEGRKSKWSAQELYTLATLMEAVHAYPEAARYDFALYNVQGSLSSGVDPHAEGLAAIIRILLSTPDQPIELGANNLTMYRDLATVDRGPGYWNGILSLWLNSESPDQAYHDEEQRAQPYFHRAKAAELLATLDREEPQAPARAELHKELIQTYVDYGQGPLVIKAGNDFLADFVSPEEETNRVAVAMYVADAYARQGDTNAEFALYDRMLTELGARTAGMPLTASAASAHASVALNDTSKNSPENVSDEGSAPDAETPDAGSVQPTQKIEKSRAFEVGTDAPSGIRIEGSREYQQLLERYLGRLTAVGQLPQALGVLRRELDRNPNDPLLYERLADFLQQNDLSAQEEEVYNRAIQKFQDRGWYDKLARLYLREKKREAYAELTRKVTDIFAGTELEGYFNSVNGGSAELYLQLNLYAHQRFPHDQVFVEHLLSAYRSKSTYDLAAWEKLLREHWSENEELRQRFFDYLSSNGRLEGEVAQLRSLVPNEQAQQANPNAVRELAEAALWQSHFEESAPLLARVAAAYPANEEVGTEASSVFRSLAYFNTRETEHAVAIEKNLLAADPANTDRWARIGDIYADSGADSAANTAGGHENIAAASPYWRRMAAIHPGRPDGYLQAATIFWDYYQFDEAMAEIRAARTRFSEPALYGYEAGAIDEGKRDMAAAIHEYAAAAIDAGSASTPEGDSSSTARLLQLARRKASAQMVDNETLKVLATSNAIAALELRERVLEVQRRNAEIGPLLESELKQAKTFEQAQAIGAQAQAHSLTKVYELALQREVALVTDSVQKIEITYEIARSYESRKEAGAASQLIDEIYRENPKLLGVVRTTVDYYSRNRQQAKAISTLIDASSAAKPTQPELSRQLVVEAADKANDSGSYAQARSLMGPLMPAGSEDAYNAQYIAVVAESYAREGDDVGLKRFYLDKLATVRGSGTAMTGDARKQKTVLLRRSLIPALTRMKDYAGAVDQYIAILSAYPEDKGATQEATLYALRYGRRTQLVGFVDNTAKASPKDSRFAIMLGQIDTLFEDYPGAIDAYARAITIRADRTDVYTAKADLEERLQRLDDTCKDYERLYVLSYQNPQWMLKVAAVRARQGRKEDTVKALEQAWLAGHKGTASDFFRVAEQLESWKMLDASLHYAELGVKAEGEAFLAGGDSFHRDSDVPEGAVIYTRLLTEMRQQAKALEVLDAARSSSDKSANSPGLVVEQAEKQGLASVSDAEWRKRLVESRRRTADQRYRSAIVEMGKTVNIYFTPEEKRQFAHLVDARWNATRATTVNDHLQWIDVAEAAGLTEDEASMRKQELLSPAFYEGATMAASRMQAYVRLERARMEYVELAQALESYAQELNHRESPRVRLEEAHAYRSAGDELAELQVMRKIDFRVNAGPEDRARYFELLLKHDVPAFELFGRSSDQEEYALSAPNYALAHSYMKVARAALSNHSAIFKGQWENAYASLLGLYFHDFSPGTEGSFHSLLADGQTIAQRMQSHTSSSADAKDGNQQPIAGDLWFYYGMRYGVYRTLAPKKEWARRDPEDLLAAGLEQTVTAASYVTLAKAYADDGDIAGALREYRHVLELAPDSPAIHDAMALLLWQSGKKDEAIAEWRLALVTLSRIVNKGPAPESFWSGFARVAQHLEERKVTTQLHGEMDALLRNYIKINGNYRSEELLKSAFGASSSPVDGVNWILSLSDAASAPLDVLTELSNAAWLPASAREPILLRELDLARIGSANVGANDYGAQRVLQAQKSLILYYESQKKDSEAESILRSLTDTERQDGDLFEVEMELAARSHHIEALLAGLQSDTSSSGSSGTVPSSQGTVSSQRLQMLRIGASRLAGEGLNAEALTVWEFVFQQLEMSHELMASDYAGLAEALLKNGDVAGAVDILRRMTLLPSGLDSAGADTSGAMENYNHAATLLVENGHDEEAIAFLSALVTGVPWNGAFALRLAQAELRTGKQQNEAIASLEALAAENQQGYDLRLQAALSMQGRNTHASKLGSEELRLLTVGKITSEQARQPYFVAARMAAADGLLPQAGAERLLLLREAIAMQPGGLAETDFATPVYFTGKDLALKIFVDEAAARHDATALVVIEPMLAGSNGGMYSDSGANIYAANSQASASDGEANSGDEATEAADSDEALELGDATLAELERAAPLPGTHPLKEAEKLRLATLIAQVYEGTDSATGALPYLRLAHYLQEDKAQASALQQHIDEVARTLWLEAQNASRRPVIQKALHQGGVVRPRLTSTDAAHMEAQ